MLLPSRFYRKFKCVCEWKDGDTNVIYIARKTIDLGDVNSYEEYPGGDLDNSCKRTSLFFVGGKPPITIRMSYDEFDAIFEKYHFEMGTLDSRTQKKKLNYNGPMKYFFDKSTHFIVTTSYPKDFDFNDKPMDVIQDAILYSQIIPMN